MKLKAIMKGGLINGTVVGLAIHWIGIALMYEVVYGFKWPSIISAPLNILAEIALGVGLLSIGPYAIILAKEGVKSKGEGFLTGAGSGVIVGLIVYLVVGALASTLALGTVPLIIHLIEPEQLSDEGLFNVLQPVVKTAITGTYIIIFSHMLIGALIGGVEGLVFVMVRGWKRGSGADQAEEEISIDS